MILLRALFNLVSEVIAFTVFFLVDAITLHFFFEIANLVFKNAHS